jgi:hypothetical protein
MKSFQVPFDMAIAPRKAELELDPAAKGERCSFRKFATFIWLDDPRAYTEGEGPLAKIVFSKQVRWAKVCEKFESALPSEWITLDDQDFETLKKIVESPSRQFQTATGPAVHLHLACVPFSEAVLGAVEQIPAHFDPPKTEERA